MQSEDAKIDDKLAFKKRLAYKHIKKKAIAKKNGMLDASIKKKQDTIQSKQAQKEQEKLVQKQEKMAEKRKRAKEKSQLRLV